MFLHFKLFKISKYCFNFLFAFVFALNYILNFELVTAGEIIKANYEVMYDVKIINVMILMNK